MSSLDPQQEKRKAAKAKSAKVLDRLGVKELELTEYEGIYIRYNPILALTQSQIRNNRRRSHSSK
jgi:hypothetical protein